MHPPHELFVRDVRCFHGSQKARLRPITLLVGENSTGKTTLLGCYSALHQMMSAPFLRSPIDFNQAPFSMGSFREMVRSRRGSKGRIERFELGFRMERRANGLPPHSVNLTFSEQRSQPEIHALRYDFEFGFLEISRTEADGSRLAVEGYSVELDVPFDLRNIDYLLSDPSVLEVDDSDVRPFLRFLDKVSEGKQQRRSFRRSLPFSRLPRLLPVAPLRAKPHRTYDPVRETASPEGAHIPMLMMRLEHAKGRRWESLRGDLNEFGNASGLFSDIRVKRHGRQMSDSFQLQVKVHSGSHANIMDVGYGVSQSLPILVELLSTGPEDYRMVYAGRRGVRFLLQQPEVHLHPRGQAELANFFVNSVQKRGHEFLIETHSDYIIDRIRILIRRGMIESEKVSILYFEPKRNSVEIHNLSLDKYGNIQNAPSGYRDFFMRETDSLIGIDE